MDMSFRIILKVPIPSSFSFPAEWRLHVYGEPSLITQLTQQFSKPKMFQGALSWHFCCFPDTTVQRSFFLTFTPAKNIALNFGTKTSINFLKCFWYIFGFAFRMGTRTCHPSPSLPSTTTESSKQSLCSYLVFSKQTSSQFMSFL